MTGQSPTANGTLRAPPTGNPYMPPVIMSRPQQGYQPQNNVQQAPRGDYAYRSQYVAPIQRPMQQWAIPQYEAIQAPMPYTAEDAVWDAEGRNGPQPSTIYNPPA